MTAILNHGFAVVRMSICLYTDFFVKTLFFCGVKHTHMLKKHGQFMAVNIPMYSIVKTKLEKIILLCIRKKMLANFFVNFTRLVSFMAQHQLISILHQWNVLCCFTSTFKLSFQCYLFTYNVASVSLFHFDILTLLASLSSLMFVFHSTSASLSCFS